MKPYPLRVRSAYSIAAGFVIILGIAIHLLLAYPVHKYAADSDAVASGLCGVQIMLGHHSLMNPGVAHHGALSCYVSAGIFSLFGVSRETLEIQHLIFAFLFLVFSYLYLREAFEVRASLAGLLFVAIPPLQMLIIPNQMGYEDILIYGAATLWLATVIDHRKPRKGWYFALGISIGLGLWCSLLSLTIILPVLCWLSLRRLWISTSRVMSTAIGVLAGGSPLWIFLIEGGLGNLVGDSVTHPANAVLLALENFHYLIFTIIPWLFTGAPPGGTSLFRLTGIVLLLYAVAALLLCCFAVWPNSRLRRRPELLSQVILFGLVVACCVGMFSVSAAGSVRGWTTRYICLIYLVIPGMAAVLYKLFTRHRLVLLSTGVAFLLFMNLADYPFPPSQARRISRSELVGEEQLIHRLERLHVKAVLGGYWDVYSINFDAKGAILALPIDRSDDFFHVERRLGTKPLRWALIDHSAAHLAEWKDRLNMPGHILAAGSDKYAAILADEHMAGEGFLRRARTTDPAYGTSHALTSFSEEITSPVRRFDVQAGGDYTIMIEVKNTGTQPWPERPGTYTPVDASYCWLNSEGKALPIEGNRAYCHRPVVPPGGSDKLKLRVTAPTKSGSYTLLISMVQEGVAWFFQRGAKPLLVRANVYSPKSTASLPSPARSQVLRQPSHP